MLPYIVSMVILFVAAMILIYVLSLQGRTGHPGLTRLQGWSYAHRGLHGPGVPENSMAAFRAALEAGYGIELDVHLLADGNLAVIHDSQLQRVTGQSGKAEELTTEQLANYRLEGTEETIPEFRQVLELFAGKAPMIIELKTAGGNAAALCETVCRMLEGYPGPYCIESFDSKCLLWLKKNRPNVIRGQLSGHFMPWFLACNVVNFITRPDFIAYSFSDRKTLSNVICREVYRMQGVSWTLRTQKDFDTAVAEGWLPIFETIRPAGKHPG